MLQISAHPLSEHDVHHPWALFRETTVLGKVGNINIINIIIVIIDDDVDNDDYDWIYFI